MVGGTLLLAVAGAAFVAPLTAQDEVALADRNIRVRDVLNFSRAAASERRTLGSHIIAALPPGRMKITVSRKAVASLLRRRMPLVRASTSAGSITFSLRALPARERPCFALARPMTAGETVTANNLIPSACVPFPSRSVKFDRESGALRAVANLESGQPVGRVSPPSPPAVRAGSRLTLISRAGAVEVTRHVTALQSGRAGSRIFVRDSDGKVGAFRLAVSDPKDIGR